MESRELTLKKLQRIHTSWSATPNKCLGDNTSASGALHFSRREKLLKYPLGRIADEGVDFDECALSMLQEGESPYEKVSRIPRGTSKRVEAEFIQ